MLLSSTVGISTVLANMAIASSNSVNGRLETGLAIRGRSQPVSVYTLQA